MRSAALVSAVLFLAACGKKNQQPALVTPPPVPAPVPPPKATVAPKRKVPRTAVTKPSAQPPAEQVTPPALERYTTPEERAEFTREIDARVQTAEQNLAALKQRGIASIESDRVASFIRQARSAQASGDLTSAQSFAERAAILSRDLLTR